MFNLSTLFWEAHLVYCKLYVEVKILRNLSEAYAATDIEAEAFEFRYKLQNYGESQDATFLNIPLKVQWETSGNTRFYIPGGPENRNSLPIDL